VVLTVQYDQELNLMADLCQEGGWNSRKAVATVTWNESHTSMDAICQVAPRGGGCFHNVVPASQPLTSSYQVLPTIRHVLVLHVVVTSKFLQAGKPVITATQQL